VPLDPGFDFPIDAVLRAIGSRTRLVWLTNPNNPTGQPIPREAIERIAAAAPGALVMVDEAYADFSGDTLLGSGLLERRANVVVGRTFAKAYGLAGLRIGAVIGQPQSLTAMRRVVPPYTINVCAAVALPVALGDTAYYDWYLSEVSESKRLLYEEFTRRGITHWKSAANFVLARFEGRGSEVAAALAKRDVHVRDRSGDPGCADCLRITAGIVEHTRTFLATLAEVV
jgi:histidinol-phosphate aminotransferase